MSRAPLNNRVHELQFVVRVCLPPSLARSPFGVLRGSEHSSGGSWWCPARGHAPRGPARPALHATVTLPGRLPCRTCLVTPARCLVKARKLGNVAEKTKTDWKEEALAGKLE